MSAPGISIGVPGVSMSAPGISMSFNMPTTQPVYGQPTPVFTQQVVVAAPQPQQVECAKCHGKRGLGTFGPCEPGNMHFKANCPTCRGGGKYDGGPKCPKCDGQGGLGTFGPCEATPPNMHFKEMCPVCKGSCYLPMYTRLNKCSKCGGQGGMGTFGPCDAYPKHMHFKSFCPDCNGRCYI